VVVVAAAVILVTRRMRRVSVATKVDEHVVPAEDVFGPIAPTHFFPANGGVYNEVVRVCEASI
jgi:hypothetical protein